ncbi:MAG: peptidylprolyl isomerase [Pseudomonadota bacterium]
MIIEKDRVVTLAYQLFALEEGREPLLVEERSVDDPLEFLFGEGVLLAKLEDAIGGQSRGYQTQVELHPRDAYGLHQPELQAWLEKSQFPKEQDIQLGMKFQTQGPSGDVISVIVKEITDEKVMIDGNHPLAGLSVRFDLNILRVREATDQEIIKKEVDPRQLH